MDKQLRQTGLACITKALCLALIFVVLVDCARSITTRRSRLVLGTVKPNMDTHVALCTQVGLGEKYQFDCVLEKIKKCNPDYCITVFDPGQTKDVVITIEGIDSISLRPDSRSRYSFSLTSDMSIKSELADVYIEGKLAASISLRQYQSWMEGNSLFIELENLAKRGLGTLTSKVLNTSGGRPSVVFNIHKALTNDKTPYNDPETGVLSLSVLSGEYFE